MSDQVLTHRAPAAERSAPSAARPRTSSAPPTPPAPPITLDAWAMIVAGAVFVVLVFAGVIPPAWQ